MKKVDKRKQLKVIDVNKKLYIFASYEALVEHLFCSKTSKLLNLFKDNLIISIKNDLGDEFFAFNIYWQVKERNQKPKVLKTYHKHHYGKSKNYLFASKEKDSLFIDEPKGKPLEQRGFDKFDDSWLRKNQRNWKKFRKTQYKQ